jgi:tetratricopeptide (TPR) repeat protein
MRTALAMEAYLYEWDWHRGQRIQARSELDKLLPGLPLHSHLLTLDRPQQALDAGRRALELDPLDLPINAHQGWQYLCIRQYNEAIGSLQKTIDLEPGFPTAHRYLGLVYEDTAKFSDAIAELEKTVRLTGGNTSALALLGHAYAAANQGAQAQGILQQLNAMSKEKYVSSYLVGAIYAALGQRDDAFGYLKRAYEERDSWMGHLKLGLRHHVLRADRRFTDLLQRMNLSR